MDPRVSETARISTPLYQREDLSRPIGFRYNQGDRQGEDDLMVIDHKGEGIPIYSTSGDWAAMLLYPNLFNPLGEWVGWVTPNHDVFDVEGRYVGYLDDEPRILRRRLYDYKIPRRDPPDPPKRINTPALVPLPPFFRELPFEIIDVVDEDPDRLHPIDVGEFKEDMD